MYLDTVISASASHDMWIKIGSILVTLLLSIGGAILASKKETREALDKKADKSALDEIKKDLTDKIDNMSKEGERDLANVKNDFKDTIEQFRCFVSARFEDFACRLDDIKDLIKMKQ
jgi:hypothetical protein